MAICDAEYRILYVDVGCNGRQSDGGVSNRSSFGQRLDADQINLPPPKLLKRSNTKLPYVFVADDAFAMRKNMFRVLRAPIYLDAAKTRKLTLACCALHNFLMERNPPANLTQNLADR